MKCFWNNDELKKGKHCCCWKTEKFSFHFIFVFIVKTCLRFSFIVLCFVCVHFIFSFSFRKGIDQLSVRFVMRWFYFQLDWLFVRSFISFFLLFSNTHFIRNHRVSISNLLSFTEEEKKKQTESFTYRQILLSVHLTITDLKIKGNNH